jgi:hypothetical protein
MEQEHGGVKACTCSITVSGTLLSCSWPHSAGGGFSEGIDTECGFGKSSG